MKCRLMLKATSVGILELDASSEEAAVKMLAQAIREDKIDFGKLKRIESEVGVISDSNPSIELTNINNLV